MGLLSRLNPFRLAPSNGLVDDILRKWGVASVGPAGSGVYVTPDVAMRCAAVYACVRVIAESMAQLPLPVYRRLPNGDKVRAPEHPVHALLNRRPNPWQTAYEFREMMIGHVCLRGNAFAYVNRVRGVVPQELIPLRPGSVAVEQNDDYSLKYTYTDLKGRSRPVPRTNIFHLRGLSSDGITGMTPITAYRESVGLAIAVESHQSKSFANGAKFRGYLTHPKVLTDDAAKRIREDFDREHVGENAYKTPLLEEGMSWVSAGMTDTDAKTIEARKMARSDIASIFRVPPHMIGDLDRATFSNIEEQNLQFASSALGPWCCRVEQSADRDLIGDADDQHFVEHNLEGMLRGDTLSRYQAHNLAINGGWKSRNEVRALENLNRVDGLDEFLSPLNMTKVADEPLMKPKEKANAPTDPAAAR